MRLRYCIIIVLSIIHCWLVVPDCARAQDFPYLAPTAPEFDSATSASRGPSKNPNSQGTGPKISPVTPQIMKDFGFGPPTDDTPEQVVSSPPVRPKNDHSTNGNPHSRTNPQSQFRQDAPPPGGRSRPIGPVQQRPRADCSQYPALIANARSEAEMQMTARYYLTCLLQGGVPIENARAQVIQTIEAALRVGR